MKTHKIEAQDVQRVFDRLQAIVDLVARVLAKYPYETLPEHLKPFVGHRPISIVRPSTDARREELVVRTAAPFLDRQMRVPMVWLGMHESQITAEVRREYWRCKEQRQLAELARLGKSVEEHDHRVRLQSEQAEADRRAHRQLAARIAGQKTQRHG